MSPGSRTLILVLLVPLVISVTFIYCVCTDVDWCKGANQLTLTYCLPGKVLWSIRALILCSCVSASLHLCEMQKFIQVHMQFCTKKIKIPYVHTIKSKSVSQYWALLLNILPKTSTLIPDKIFINTCSYFWLHPILLCFKSIKPKIRLQAQAKKQYHPC